MTKGQAKPIAETPSQDKNQNKLWMWVVAVILVTLICYSPIFSENKQFTNWDDNDYVTEQPLVKSLDGDNISKLFDPNTAVAFNYHPLTMLTLAWDYQRAFDESDNTISIAPFVRTNIIFHLINTSLVFLLIYRLGKRRLWAATLGALLFGIHPMHVESVAWVSARKDLLYCFFFLLSCLAYLRYLDGRKMSYLVLCFALFVASCLSKAMAVPLPFVLLFIDYLEQRKLDTKALLEKLLFVAFAIWIGLNSIHLQEGAMQDAEFFNLGQRIMFASYGFIMYWVKLLLPFNLSAIHPYPGNVGSSLPFIYNIAPVIAIAFLVAVFLLSKRIQDQYKGRVIVFGVLFFMAMIALVLQFVSVGQAVMSERYTYISYIGPLFIAGVFANDLISQPKFRNIVLGIVGAVTLAFAAITYQRVEVWQDSHTLWTDVISKYPYKFTEKDGKQQVAQAGAKAAYKNMGVYYAEQKELDSAYYYFETLVLAGIQDAQTWSNLGSIYFLKKQIPEAIDAYSKAIVLDGSKPEYYMTRGLLFAETHQFPKAIADMDKILQLDPSNTRAAGLRQRMFEAKSKQP